MGWVSTEFQGFVDVLHKVLTTDSQDAAFYLGITRKPENRFYIFYLPITTVPLQLLHHPLKDVNFARVLSFVGGMHVATQTCLVALLAWESLSGEQLHSFRLSHMQGLHAPLWIALIHQNSLEKKNP